MKKTTIYKYLITYLLTCSSICVVHSSAPGKAEEDTAVENSLAGTMLPQEKFSPVELAKIDALIHGKQSREIPFDPATNNRDFGFSFSTPSATQILLTAAIRVMANPTCYDIGSGHGTMSMMMVFAGGNVTAVEQNEAVVEAANLEIRGHLIKIPEDVKRKIEYLSKLSIHQGDALDLENKTLYPDDLQINVCNLSRFLHFLPPEQVSPFLKGLFEKMAPGGGVYAQVHSASDSPLLVQSFFKEKQGGRAFPGHLRVSYNLQNQVTAVVTAQETDLPGTCSDNKGTTQRILHYFDPDTLRQCFKSAGFEVIIASYVDDHGGFAPNASQADLGARHYDTSVIAFKPGAPTAQREMIQVAAEMYLKTDPQ